jgi:hypothetical protein
MKDNSGTITTGGTWQQVSANASRSWFDFQNISEETLHLFQSFGGATPPASSPYPGAIAVPAGALFEPLIRGTVGGVLYVVGPTTGQGFTSREI